MNSRLTALALMEGKLHSVDSVRQVALNDDDTRISDQVANYETITDFKQLTAEVQLSHYGQYVNNNNQHIHDFGEWGVKPTSYIIELSYKELFAHTTRLLTQYGDKKPQIDTGRPTLCAHCVFNNLFSKFFRLKTEKFEVTRTVTSLIVNNATWSETLQHATLSMDCHKVILSEHAKVLNSAVVRDGHVNRLSSFDGRGQLGVPK